MSNRAVYQAKRQRLAALETRAACYGIDTPPEVLIEIADLRREIGCSLLVNPRDLNTLPLCVILALLALTLAVLVLVAIILLPLK